MEINKKDVGLRIRSIRKDRGMTLDDFGDLLNPPASDSIVSRWERGVSLPSNERTKQIAEEGKITVDELLYGSKSEQVTRILREELGEEADLKIIKEVVGFFEATGDEYSLNKDYLVDTYDSFLSHEEHFNNPVIDSTLPKYAHRSFDSSELIQFLNEKILELENEITIIEHELNNNKNIDEDEFLELRSILNNLGLYSVHLEKIIEQIKIPSQDFYIYEGVFYFAIKSTDLTFESIKFDVSKYDTLVVFDIYNQVVTRLSDLNAKKILDVIRKYPITYEDVYKFEITKLPTKWFVTDYEVIKEPEEIQIISNKVINISGI